MSPVIPSISRWASMRQGQAGAHRHRHQDPRGRCILRKKAYPAGPCRPRRVTATTAGILSRTRRRSPSDEEPLGPTSLKEHCTKSIGETGASRWIAACIARVGADRARLSRASRTSSIDWAFRIKWIRGPHLTSSRLDRPAAEALMAATGISDAPREKASGDAVRSGAALACCSPASSIFAVAVMAWSLRASSGMVAASATARASCLLIVVIYIVGKPA